MRSGLHSEQAPHSAGGGCAFEFLRIRRIERGHRLPRRPALDCRFFRDSAAPGCTIPGVSFRSRNKGAAFMQNESLEQSVQVSIAEKVFTNGPNMLVLCLTVIGLTKIYTRFEKITTLADNFLAFISIGYLIATIVAYVAIRSRDARARLKLARIADLTFLISLGLTAAVALFMTFALEG